MGRKGAHSSSKGRAFRTRYGAFDFEIPVEPTSEVLKPCAPAKAVLLIVSDVPNSRYAGTVQGIAKNQAVIDFSSSVAAVHPGMQARMRLEAE